MLHSVFFPEKLTVLTEMLEKGRFEPLFAMHDYVAPESTMVFSFKYFYLQDGLFML